MQVIPLLHGCNGTGVSGVFPRTMAQEQGKDTILIGAKKMQNKQMEHKTAH